MFNLQSGAWDHEWSWSVTPESMVWRCLVFHLLIYYASSYHEEIYHTVHASPYFTVWLSRRFTHQDRARNVLRFNQGCEKGERTLESYSFFGNSVHFYGLCVINFEDYIAMHDLGEKSVCIFSDKIVNANWNAIFSRLPMLICRGVI